MRTQPHDAAVPPAAVAEHTPSAQERAPGRRATRISYLAAAWSLLFGGLTLSWAVLPGWLGSPFTRSSADGPPPPLASGVPPLLLVAVSLIGAGLAVAMANRWGGDRSHTRSVVVSTAWLVAGALAVLMTSERLLVLVGYAPIYVVGAPFGWPPDSYFDHVTWASVHEAISLVGAVLWAAAAAGYQARTAATPDAATRAARAQVTRRDRAAVAIAVAVPLFYAVTRYAWLLGIPLGISEQFLREGQRVGLWIAGAGLATFAVVGAVLTLGLVQRWGEVFPRWMPVIGGRRVPPALAEVPATGVAVLLTTGGVTLWRQFLLESPPIAGWVSVAPAMLMPVWGIALAVATAGYRRRRRA